MEQWIADYIAAQQKALNSVPQDTLKTLIDVIRKAWAEDRQIFVAGNGGSAANASHFTVDLGKGASDVLSRRFRVLSLTDNVPWITAIGNDYSYDDIFVRQLTNYARAGDIFIGISVSGNSPNLVKAHQWAKDQRMVSIALVGAKRGRMADLADHALVIGDTHYGRVEDVQMNILHMLCYAFWERPEIVR